MSKITKKMEKNVIFATKNKKSHLIPCEIAFYVCLLSAYVLIA